MEKDEMKKTQEMKTDLNLLLECLKYQMDNPSSQKEALVTIYSVCQQNSDASIYFREIGGLMFVKNLAKSSIHSMVKEAALFTLGAIAECNVYCQQTLCTSEFFEDIIWFLSKYESNINLKRMSVYVMLVLVSNNNVNQKICSSVFQHANKWLQSCMKPEIIRPICSFICLTVANNTHVQEYFISIGGLAILSEVLIKLEHDSHGDLPSAKLAVVVTKTLDACIADNPAVGVVLAKYHIVSKLLTLLLHESLDSGEKFSIILTLGHCTEACEENQLHLFKNNGLPLMIQVLTESQNEELNKAATFVLHNCRKITEKLSLNLEEFSSDMDQAQELKELKVKEKNIEDFWKKAKEILHRIKKLENKEDEEKVKRRELFGDSLPRSLNIPNTSKYSRGDNIVRGTNAERNGPKKQRQPHSCEPDAAERCEAFAGNEPQEPAGSDRENPVSTCYKECGPSTMSVPSTATTPRSHSLYKGATRGKRALFLPASEQACKCPAPVVRNRKHQSPVADPLVLCSDIISKEASNFQRNDSYHKTLNFRCSGCIEVGKSLNSRNFSRLLHSCPFQCDRHKVILEAEDRYKSDLRKSLIFNKKILLTPHKKRRFDNESCAHEERTDFQNHFQRTQGPEKSDLSKVIMQL
ncbi:telomere repeats-binding bouquet formation protein 1 isoform X5 [Notamacropus eugenii]|uniref:telomere repeats-binding bouquet formation protein 1 isoform X5 n=1 Tax=Notamacropus eugenii TaxID=9315 RepID=UPI003B679646